MTTDGGAARVPVEASAEPSVEPSSRPTAETERAPNAAPSTELHVAPQALSTAGAPTDPITDPSTDLSTGPSTGLAADPDAERPTPSHPADAAVVPLLRRLAAMPSDDPARAALREQIVESQLALVHHLAQRFRGRGEPYDDLVQVGTIGLLNAVDRFDPSRDSFTAFAVPTILGEIRRHFRDRGWALRVPRRLQDMSRRVAETRESLTQTLGRSPTVQELAQHLDADPDLVLEALDTPAAYATVPLPSVPDEAAGTTLGELDSGMEDVENRETLRPLLERLPARERTILRLRFAKGMSQSQIAAEVGVSQMHVSRLLARSLATLRESLSEEV